jgi:transposase
LSCVRFAVKLFDKGFSVKQILKKVNRSRSWFYKWYERFTIGGYSALKDRAKTAHHFLQTTREKMLLWFFVFAKGWRKLLWV